MASHIGGDRGTRLVRKRANPETPKGSAAKRARSAEKWNERDRVDYDRMLAFMPPRMRTSPA